MAPTWADFAPQDGPKLAPKWGQNRSKHGLGSEVGSRTDSGTILGPILVDFGSILGPILIDFGTIFGRSWKDFWVGSLVGFCVFFENYRENGGCVT